MVVMKAKKKKQEKEKAKRKEKCRNFEMSSFQASVKRDEKCML